MHKALNIKYKKLTKIISGCRSVAVAFSGGVDSTLLLKVCQDTLKENCLAVFSDSILQPARERKATLELAAKIGSELIILEGVDLHHEAFRNNPKNRCYLCKGLIFDRIIEAASKRGITCIFDGSNVDDQKDYRPGKRALMERNVQSPLQEAGLTKADIRELSKELGLPTWDKDALACLATRIPYNEEITKEKLQLIDAIETRLVEAGFRNVRARLRKEYLSIEVREDQILLLKKRIHSLGIGEMIKNTSWKEIKIDQTGYQQGKMNQNIVS